VGWREFTGHDATERSQEALRQKLGFEKGLSAETAAAVQAGDLEIVPDDPQSELLKEIHEE
jgi:hypothetical protein